MSVRARWHWQRPGFTLEADLQLPARGVTALFGPSGSGKTTLLRCMAGLDRPPEGLLSVQGEVWQGPGQWLAAHRRPIGYVFQDANLFPHLSVRDNLRFGLSRLRQQGRPADLQAAIELLGIEHLLQRMPAGLSGGERQRVGMARALAVQPRLLLMDEPLASLDLQRKQEVLPYLERLRDELALPMVYVSHAPDEVARLANHLVVMAAGRVVAQGPLADTLARTDLPIRLGEDTGVVLQGEVAERDAQWQLCRVAFAGGSLWARDAGLPVGRPVRLRVLARDVSLTTTQPQDTSITNVLPGVVADVADEAAHPSLALARVQVGPAVIVARLTRRSVSLLALQPGQPVWVQIKSVALMTP